MEIILVGGKANSGKNLVGEMIKEYCDLSNKNCLVLGNGDKVREYAKKYFKLDDYKTEEGRRIMLGLTDMMYDLTPFYYEHQTEVAIAKHKSTLPKGETLDVVVITDWRLPCTYDYFENQHYVKGIHSIYLQRNNIINYGEYNTSHLESKEPLKDYIDYTVYNLGTKGDLRDTILAYLEHGVFNNAN